MMAPIPQNKVINSLTSGQVILYTLALHIQISFTFYIHIAFKSQFNHGDFTPMFMHRKCKATIMQWDTI